MGARPHLRLSGLSWRTCLEARPEWGCLGLGRDPPRKHGAGPVASQVTPWGTSGARPGLPRMRALGACTTHAAAGDAGSRGSGVGRSRVAATGSRAVR